MIYKVVVVWSSNLDLSVVNLNIQDVLFPIFAVVLSSVYSMAFQTCRLSGETAPLCDSSYNMEATLVVFVPVVSTNNCTVCRTFCF